MWNFASVIEEKKFAPKHLYPATIGRGLGYTSFRRSWLQPKTVMCMKTIFRTAFYLRSNYVNKDGKVPVMLRIYLNNERLSLSSTGIAILRSQWDGKKERVKGRSTEVLSINLELDNIQNGLLNIFRRMEFNESLSLERIKMEFLGKKEDIGTIMELFDRHIADVKK